MIEIIKVGDNIGGKLIREIIPGPRDMRESISLFQELFNKAEPGEQVQTGRNIPDSGLSEYDLVILSGQ
jgi:hypothetical protein